MTESQPAVGICADPVRDERFGFSKRLPLSIRILLVMERGIRRPPGSLPGAAIATVVGAVVVVALFGYLFRGASVWATVDGPVQKVRNGSDYDYRAVVEYRPREDVADLCRDSGVCRAIVDVPRNAAVGDEIRIRHLLKDPLRAHSISWTAFGVPGELLIPFVLAVLAALIGLPLSIWHLRFRRTPSAAAVGAVLSALFAVAVLMMVLSGEYTHPMLRVLGVVAGVAVVYWFAKATRLWNRP